MSAISWPGADGSSQQPPPPPLVQDAALDRQMINHLVNRYTPDQLARLLLEARTPQSDAASIVSSAQSSVISDEPASVWDSQSVRSFSDTTSITGSIISNVSRGTAKLLSRRNGSSSTAAAQAQASQQVSQVQQEMQSWNGLEVVTQPNPAPDAASTTSGASKQKGAFMCGFCKEEEILKTCTRKNDLKRHIEDFHNVNAQWFCRHRGCQMVFDWQGAYKTHLKQAHGGSRMSLDEAKVNLCPQVVFACGFENCLQVFEAPSDGDAQSTFKEYVSHVVKHFDEGSNSGDWSYSARIRNLLRQSQIHASWTESVLRYELAQDRMRWSPQTSGILRKRLECRHVGDIKLLIQYACILGTEPNGIRKFREDFITPIADTCTMNMPGHKTRHQAVAAQEPADPFSFRISRGTNPALAAYLASQRKVYVPRQRPIRPPQLHQTRAPAPTSNPMAGHTLTDPHGQQHQQHQQHQQQHHTQHHHQQHHQQHQHQQLSHNPTQGHFFASLPEVPPSSPLYDSNGPQPFSPTNSILHQNGIIADDLQSLRTMASGTPEPADVEMHDTGMMQDFSAAYPTQSLHSPAHSNIGSPSMSDHTNAFYHDDQTPHAY